MTRIVVYGDSHAGAFKDGWESIRGDHPGVELQFFALPHPYVRRIDLRADGTLAVRPAAEGDEIDAVAMAERILGRTEVDVASADMVIWAGYPSPTLALARMLGSTAIDGVYEADRPILMSRAAFDACLGPLAAAALPPRRWTNRLGDRLVLALRANPSEACLALRRSPELAPWQRMATGGADARPAFAALAGRTTRAIAESGARCLPQPGETLAPSGLTADAWSRGSRRIVNDREHPRNDYVHMNGVYGALCLTALLGDRAARGRPEAAVGG